MEKYEYGYLIFLRSTSTAALVSTGSVYDAWDVEDGSIPIFDRLGALGWVINEGSYVELRGAKPPTWIVELAASKLDSFQPQQHIDSYTTHFMRRRVA